MQHINNTPADSGLGDTLKVAFDKVNANFQELVAIDSSFSGDIQTLNTIISDGSTLNHTHTISQIIGLQTALSGKVSTSTFNTQILGINSSIQAINSTLSDIIDILNSKIGEAPFSGITYGRRDGQWVEVTGGPTGDFVPYSGGTKDIVLSANSITANGGFISSNQNNVFEFGTNLDVEGNKSFKMNLMGDGINFSTGYTFDLFADLDVGFDLSLSNQDNLSNKRFRINDSSFTFLTTLDGVSNEIEFNEVNLASSKKIISNEGFEGNYLKLNTDATEINAVGKMYWNDTQGTINFGLKGGQTSVKSGVDLVVRVVNKVSPNTTLTKAAYQAVRISGAQGQRLAIKLAQANNDNNSADTIGLVCETIAPNQEGFIITMGQLEGLNTTGSLQGENWQDGDVLYLSPTIAGRLTNIKPTGATGHIVVMGYVEYAHINNGKIYVKIMNGWELDELHNVNISGASSGQVLRYDGTNWVNSNQKWEGIDDVNSGNGVSGTTIETLDKTYMIPPNTLVDGHLDFSFYSIRETGSSLAHQVVVRVNNVNNFATATEIFRSQTNGNFNPYLRAQRKFTLKNNLIRNISGIGANFTDLNSGPTGVSVPFNLSGDIYIFFSTIPGATNQIIKYDSIQIKQL